MLRFALKFYSFFQIPHMTKIERDKIKAILSDIENPCIFEYGSGYSTLYFAKFLRKKNKKFMMYSVDSSIDWHKRVKKLIDRNHLGESVKTFYEGNEQDYAHYLKRFSRKFDFILVDGRFRRRCLEVVAHCLADGGVVFLHDAERPYYHEPLGLFKEAAFFESGKYYPFEKTEYKYWIGSNRPLPGKSHGFQPQEKLRLVSDS